MPKSPRFRTLDDFFLLPFTLSPSPRDDSFNPVLVLMTISITLQYAVSTLYGGNQSPGVPWGADGDGAVFYRAGMCSRVLGGILHTRRYVIAFPLICCRRIVRL